MDVKKLNDVLWYALQIVQQSLLEYVEEFKMDELYCKKAASLYNLMKLIKEQPEESFAKAVEKWKAQKCGRTHHYSFFIIFGRLNTTLRVMSNYSLIIWFRSQRNILIIRMIK